MWKSVVIPVTLGKSTDGGGGWECVTSLTLSVPLSVLSPLSTKYSTLPMGVQIE